MIGYLAGVVHGRCVVVGGVGYVVHCPSVLAEGEEVRLHVTTIVREDDISLYGFVNEVDQELFTVLRKVQGVGAGMALALLRDVGAAEVVRAVRDGEPRVLARAAGVGPKKASVLVAAAAPLMSTELIEAALEGTTEAPDGTGDLMDTLETLGFDREKAREAAAKAVEKAGLEDDSQLLSAALSYLRGER